MKEKRCCTDTEISDNLEELIALLGQIDEQPGGVEKIRQIETFALILAGGEPNRLEAAELIRKLGAEERRDLRAAIQETDALLDDVFLAVTRERRPWKL